MSVSTFFIPDISSIFNYSPCVNCGPLGWTSAFARKANGFDQTFHQAPNGSAAVAFNLTSSGFSISYDSSSSACDITYSVNGSNFAPACQGSGVESLPWGRHRVILQTAERSSNFQFFGITGPLNLPKGEFSNRSIDDTSPLFSYAPSNQWSGVDSLGPIGDLANKSAVDSLGASSRFFNSSMSVTTSRDSKVELRFTGGTVYVYGFAGPEGGAADAILDGTLQSRLNLTNPWNAYASLLWMASGLDPAREHTVSFTNTVSGKQLVVDYALVTVPKTGSPGTNIPMLIGIAIGTSLILLAVLIVIFFYFKKRRNPTRYEPKYGFADGIGYDDRSKRSSIDWWRRQTSLHSAGVTPITGSEFGDGPMGRVYAQPTMEMEMGERYPIAKLYQHSPNSTVESGLSKFTTKAIEQEPDYIPYKPPPGWTATPRSLFPHSTVLSPPRSVPNLSPKSVTRNNSIKSPLSTLNDRPDVPSTPLISGIDPISQQWIQENSSFNKRNSASYSLSIGNLSRRPSGVTQPHTDGPPSPRSISEEFKLVDVRHARRSIARLWPTGDAVPSLYRSDTLDLTTLPYMKRNGREQGPITKPGGSELSPESSAPRTGNLTAHSVGNSPEHKFPSHPDIPTPALPPSAYSNHYPISPESIYGDPSKSRSSASQSVRRGVSIKSVKTVKSFFSTLLRSDQPHTPAADRGELPIPNLPAVPRVARPDSDIFPSATGGSRPNTPGTIHRGFEDDKDFDESDLRKLTPGSAHMFIELNPESPIISRPGSVWPVSNNG